MIQVGDRGWGRLLGLVGGCVVLLQACGDDDGAADTPSAGASGTTGTAGAAQGGSSGTAPDSNGNAAGVANTGDGGSSTHGGEGGAGEGGVGGASDELPAVLTPHWFVFNHSDGLYLYDLTKFPSTGGVTQLAPYGSVFDSGWSPDGQRLITGGVGGVVLRDMSGDTPGEPQLLADCAGAQLDFLRVFEWTGDGKSAVCIRQGQELVAFDPSTAAPSLHTIDDNIVAYSMAPAGNKLAFMNEAGVYVVSIDAGKVGPPEYLEFNGFPDIYFRKELIWSPNGSYLVSLQGSGALYDLREEPLVRHPLVDPGIVGGRVDTAAFSPDSQLLAYTARQDREDLDAFYLDLLEPGKPVNVSPGLSDSEHPNWSGWVSSAHHLAYNISDGVTPGGKAFQVNVNDAATAEDLPFYLSERTTWLRGSRRVVSDAVDGLALFDLANPTAAPIPLLSPHPGEFQVAATSKVVGYEQGTHAVGVVNVDDPNDKSEVTINSGVNASIPDWQLSPDGGFLVVIDHQVGSGRTVKLIRLDGGQSSTPVALLQKGSNSPPAFSFQRAH